MFEINARTAPPYSAVCYIRCEWSDGTRTSASGVVVGTNDVLTAMHVVYDDTRGGWARKVEVVPGADTRPVLDAPFGVYGNVGSLSGRASNWDLNGDGYLTAFESQGDLALIGLQSRIGDATGVLGTSAARADTTATLSGYPGRGTGLMVEVASATPSQTTGTYQVGAALGPGSSGGPLLATAADRRVQVLGVGSAGDAGLTQSVYAALFGDGTASWLEAAIAGNDGLLATGGMTFRGSVGRDDFRGGGGIDSVLYDHVRADYHLMRSAAGWTVVGGAAAASGSDELAAVERLRFTDQNLALDLGGSAGRAALLLGAVAGSAALQDKALVGVFLSYFDAGHSIAEGAQTVLDLGFLARLAGGADDVSFVRQIWRSVVGAEASAGTVQTYVDLLHSGVSQAQLLATAAQLPQNAAHVDLVGLAQNGLAYLG